MHRRYRRRHHSAGWSSALLCALALAAGPGCDSVAPDTGGASSGQHARGTAATTTGAPAKAKGPQRIACDKPVYNYGTVSEGSTIKHVFVVKNVGGAPLAIKRASGG